MKDEDKKIVVVVIGGIIVAYLLFRETVAEEASSLFGSGGGGIGGGGDGSDGSDIPYILERIIEPSEVVYYPQQEDTEAKEIRFSLMGNDFESFYNADSIPVREETVFTKVGDFWNSLVGAYDNTFESRRRESSYSVVNELLDKIFLSPSEAFGYGSLVELVPGTPPVVTGLAGGILGSGANEAARDRTYSYLDLFMVGLTGDKLEGKHLLDILNTKPTLFNTLPINTPINEYAVVGYLLGSASRQAQEAGNTTKNNIPNTQNIIGGNSSFLSNIKNTILSTATPATNKLSGIKSSVQNAIVSNPIGQKASSAVGNAIAAVSGGGNTNSGGGGGGSGGGLRTSNASSGSSSSSGSASKSVGSAAKSAVSNATSSIKSAASNATSSVKKTVSSIGSKISGALKR